MSNTRIMQPVSNLADCQFTVKEQFFNQFNSLKNVVLFNTDSFHLAEQFTQEAILPMTFALQAFRQILDFQ